MRDEWTTTRSRRRYTDGEPEAPVNDWNDEVWHDDTDGDVDDAEWEAQIEAMAAGRHRSQSYVSEDEAIKKKAFQSSAKILLATPDPPCFLSHSSHSPSPSFTSPVAHSSSFCAPHRQAFCQIVASLQGVFNIPYPDGFEYFVNSIVTCLSLEFLGDLVGLNVLWRVHFTTLFWSRHWSPSALCWSSL